jgi:transcriptional regulator with XRE-family HTH domain
MIVAESVSRVNSDVISRWDRIEISKNINRYNEIKSSQKSQRELAKELNLPRSTLRSWLSHRESLDEDPKVIEFFESEIGLSILHRLTAALHVVFTGCGACGVGLVSLFLKLSHMDRFVASSEASQRKINVDIENIIVSYSEEESKNLSENMPKKDITVAQDETFTGGLTLVAIEPVSNYIILETESEKRDAESWDAKMKEKLDHLPVSIVQSTSDEGTGILSYVANILGAHHSPDVFHVQQSLSRAVSAAISSKLRSAEKAEKEVLKNLLNAQKEFEKVNGNANLHAVQGCPIDHEKKIEKLNELYLLKKDDKERLAKIQVELRKLVKGIGDVYHPIDIETGKRYSSSMVVSLINEKINQIREIAEAEGLSDSSLALIEKAARVVPKMESTIDFVSTYIRQQIEKFDLTKSQKLAINEYLIPALYLEKLALKKPKSKSLELNKKAEELKEKLFISGGKLADLNFKIIADIIQKSKNLVQIFQRSSSCVEGRNGVISFRNHELHNMTTRKRNALTAIHNFFITREDKTTAAERFFEQKPRDLFQIILNSVDVPARPLSPPRRCAF